MSSRSRALHQAQNFEYLSLHKKHMIVKTDTSIQGFALPHLRLKLHKKPQFRAFFDALKQPGALRARDLVTQPKITI